MVFTLSSIPQLPTPDLGFDNADKAVHFVEYLGLALLVLRAFGNLSASGNIGKAYFWAVVIAVVFAALDEYHQSFVPGRQADLYDLLADTAGVAVGTIVYFLAGRRKSPLSCNH